MPARKGRREGSMEGQFIKEEEEDLERKVAQYSMKNQWMHRPGDLKFWGIKLVMVGHIR